MMRSVSRRTAPQRRRPQPAWDIAQIFPPQGEWSEADYLELDTMRLVEFSNGHIEVLPMPSFAHQFVLLYLARELGDFVDSHRLGRVAVAPLPVKLWEEKWREPDVVFVKPGRRMQDADYPLGVDLAMEIVSEGSKNRKRDLQNKRRDYARAGIPEYWIVDPLKESISVLVLTKENKYRVHGVFRRGETATSVLLRGFEVRVDDAFDAAHD